MDSLFSNEDTIKLVKRTQCWFHQGCDSFIESDVYFRIRLMESCSAGDQKR